MFVMATGRECYIACGLVVFFTNNAFLPAVPYYVFLSVFCSKTLILVVGTVIMGYRLLLLNGLAVSRCIGWQVHSLKRSAFCQCKALYRIVRTANPNAEAGGSGSIRAKPIGIGKKPFIQTKKSKTEKLAKKAAKKAIKKAQKAERSAHSLKKPKSLRLTQSDPSIVRCVTCSTVVYTWFAHT